MLRAYLEQLGESAGQDDVDVTLFDIRSFQMGGLHIRNGLDAMFCGTYEDTLLRVWKRPKTPKQRTTTPCTTLRR